MRVTVGDFGLRCTMMLRLCDIFECYELTPLCVDSKSFQVENGWTKNK